MKRRLLAALLGGAVLSTACFDLDTTTIQPTGGTTYTRAEILANPVLMERLVAGTFVLLWAEVREAEPWIHFSIFGEEITTSASSISGDVWEIVKEPRPEVQNFLGVEHQVMRNPWHLFYESNSSAAEYGEVVRNEGIRIVDPATRIDNTPRFLAFARFVQGLSHLYLGLIFDSAAVVGAGVDLTRPLPLPLAGRQEVIDSAIKWLEDAAAIADTASFAFPLNEGQWIYRTGFDNKALAAVSHSYIARALVYSARTPDERAAVDWERVKFHLARSTKTDFGPRGFPASGGGSAYIQAMTSAPENSNALCNGECTGAGNARVDTRLVGPADTTSEYMTWLNKVGGERFDTVAPIFVLTHDQRIQQPGGTLPNVKPTFFKVTDIWPPQSIQDTTLRGRYYVGMYWNSSRARNNHTQLPRDHGGSNETDDLQFVQDRFLMAAEMDLLLAEAHLRSAPPDLQAAADLINRTRVNNGGLPPVTTTGVPTPGVGEPPCIPRVWDGSAMGRCANLFEAMMYEKRMETYATAISFFDLRGWGCLIEGTPLELAPPANQLDLLGKLVYSYGGLTGPTRGAPRPTNCPLLHRP